MSETLHGGISIRGVCRDFGDRGLSDVSLDVAPGSVVALLGPNGAGKSTLLRAAAGRLRLDRGTVRAAGGDPARDAAARRRIGFVPQDPALFPHLTAQENVETFGGLSGLGRREARRRAQALLDRLGLNAEAGRRAVVLSGGQRKRTSLAAGVVHAPAVTLLDEPTAGVDAAAREHVHALVRALRADGSAVLFCTHDVEEAEALADHVAILASGVLRAEGAPQDLVRRSFGGEREMTVVFSREVPSARRSWLAGLGFAPTEHPRTFVGKAPDAASSARLVEQFESAGLHVAESRLREASLRGVLLRMTGREATP